MEFRKRAEEASFTSVYVFPQQSLGLELEEGDDGVNAVIVGWNKRDLPKTCWNLAPGDVVRALTHSRIPNGTQEDRERCALRL